MQGRQGYHRALGRVHAEAVHLRRRLAAEAGQGTVEYVALIILMALPGAVAGIAWMLFLTHTTLSVPALMGSIMCVGVATANSILVVTFANGQREVGRDARGAALAAGMTRLRPVLMTALAMMIGMLPMSLGIGEGGEQNAPLGRAVIGGLLVATVMTLFFVPVMYSILRNKAPKADPLTVNL